MPPKVRILDPPHQQKQPLTGLYAVRGRSARSGCIRCCPAVYGVRAEYLPKLCVPPTVLLRERLGDLWSRSAQRDRPRGRHRPRVDATTSADEQRQLKHRAKEVLARLPLPGTHSERRMLSRSATHTSAPIIQGVPAGQPAGAVHSDRRRSWANATRIAPGPIGQCCSPGGRPRGTAEWERKEIVRTPPSGSESRCRGPDSADRAIAVHRHA